MKIGLTKAWEIVEKNGEATREDEHGAGENEIMGEGVDNEEENEGEEGFQKEGFADLI